MEITVDDYFDMTTAEVSGIQIGRIDSMKPIELLELLEEKGVIDLTLNIHNFNKGI